MRLKSTSLRAKRSNPGCGGWIAASACGLLAMTVFPVLTFGAEVNVETFCRLLPQYQQPAGVEYQPGVGAKGPVVPADINGAAVLRDFDSIEIPVEMDLIQRFGLNLPVGAELNPYVALMSIHKDGRVDYNGQDISREAYNLCNKGKTNE